MGGQFWDGRAIDLGHQIVGPLLNPREMNNASRGALLRKIRAGEHGALLRSLFGAEVNGNNDLAIEAVGKAIAAFERSSRFRPFRSKFDHVLRGTDQFTEQESLGFALFKAPEKGNCLACHVGDEGSRRPEDWPFTDFTYDNLGLPRNAALPDNADPASFDLGLCAREDLAELLPEASDTGELCGAFRVPTLRNVARTAPYGHNGVLGTLKDVVRFYVTRSAQPEIWYGVGADGASEPDDVPPEYRGNVNSSEVPYDRRRGEKPRLDDAEIEAVVAFLETLTDRE